MDLPNSLDFERVLEKKLRELQNARDSQWKTEKELVQTRQRLFAREAELETERTSNHWLTTRLKLTRETVSRLQDVVQQNAQLRSDASAENACAYAEREALLMDATNARERARRFGYHIAHLRKKLRDVEEQNQELEGALTLLRERSDAVLQNLESQLLKVTTEQKRLRKSCEFISTFNTRLQNAIRSFPNAEVLQEKL